MEIPCLDEIKFFNNLTSAINCFFSDIKLSCFSEIFFTSIILWIKDKAVHSSFKFTYIKLSCISVFIILSIVSHTERVGMTINISKYSVCTSITSPFSYCPIYIILFIIDKKCFQIEIFKDNFIFFRFNYTCLTNISDCIFIKILSIWIVIDWTIVFMI